MKIEKLTEEQEALLPVIAGKWIGELGCRYEKANVEKGIRFLYEISKLNEPIIIHVSSPLAAQYAANLLKVREQVGYQVWEQVREQVWEQVGNQVWEQVEEQVREPVRKQVREQVGCQVWEQVGNQVRKQVWEQVEEQVREPVRKQVREQVEEQVKEQVGNQVWNQVRNQVGIFHPFAYRGTIFDYDWLAWVATYRTFGLNFKNDKEIDLLIGMSSCFFMLQFEKLVIACEHPTKIYKDERGRLHCEFAPAVEWDDGFKLYFFEGVAISEKIIMNPEKITIQEIQEEKNLEKQRIMMNRFGVDRYLVESGATIVDADLSSRNGARALMKDSQGQKWLVCTDGSTDRVYYLAAPSNSKTCKEAHEALCGFSENRIVLEG